AILHGVPEQPPAPPALDPDELYEDLVQELCNLMREAAVIHSATDGSEHQDIGAFAVVVQPGGYRCAIGNGEEDQTSYKQELLGLDLATRAALDAARSTGWTGRIVFVVDCQAVLRVVLRQGDHFSYLLHIVNHRFDELSDLLRPSVMVVLLGGDFVKRQLPGNSMRSRLRPLPANTFMMLFDDMVSGLARLRLRRLLLMEMMAGDAG
ncbi:unnamed protein product, partial [Symbiodinium sp. CCMP2592]